jgi:hypothetical protein
MDSFAVKEKSRSFKQIRITAFILCLQFCLSLQTVYCQYWAESRDGDALFISQNPFDKAKEYKLQDKNYIICAIQHYLNMRGGKFSFTSKCPFYPDSTYSFRTLASSCGLYNNHAFVIPYRDTLMHAIRKEDRLDLCEYENATLIGLLDYKGEFRSKIGTTACANRHVLTKYARKYSFYENVLQQIIDSTDNSLSGFYFNSINLENTKLTYNNLYRLAQEIIFINDHELNKLFWKAFECKREIPTSFFYISGDPTDSGSISVAFAFGAALGNYFYDPFFYNLLSNPYSVALENGVPLDPKTYNDYIPIMEKYIRYISCQKIKVPFLLKFNKPVYWGKDKYFGTYHHYSIPEKYYILPDSCYGKEIKDFPLNFCPMFNDED